MTLRVKTLLPFATALLLVPILFTTACTIKTDKNEKGDSDNVKISTPLGGLNVRSSDVTASSVGLPEYPGAHLLTKKEDGGDDGAVDLHMGFGPWQMRVKAVNYGTSDPPEKVLTFYRSAMQKNFGDVIECRGNKPVGTPTVTRDGLTCDEHTKVGTSTQGSGVHVDIDELQLKAGSKRRQHILGMKKPEGNQTRFALVALELPNLDSGKQTTD